MVHTTLRTFLATLYRQHLQVKLFSLGHRFKSKIVVEHFRAALVLLYRVVAPPSQQAIVEQITHQLQQSDRSRRLPVAQLLGSDTISKQHVAHEVAAAFNLELYRFPAELMPSGAADLETLARLWQRENMLLPLALYLDAPATDPAALNAAPAPVYRFLARSSGL